MEFVTPFYALMIVCFLANILICPPFRRTLSAIDTETKYWRYKFQNILYKHHFCIEVGTKNGLYDACLHALIWM
jgi:hypothetical protein